MAVSLSFAHRALALLTRIAGDAESVEWIIVLDPASLHDVAEAARGLGATDVHCGENLVTFTAPDPGDAVPTCDAGMELLSGALDDLCAELIQPGSTMALACTPELQRAICDRGFVVAGPARRTEIWVAKSACAASEAEMITRSHMVTFTLPPVAR